MPIKHPRVFMYDHLNTARRMTETKLLNVLLSHSGILKSHSLKIRANYLLSDLLNQFRWKYKKKDTQKFEGNYTPSKKRI